MVAARIMRPYQLGRLRLFSPVSSITQTRYALLQQQRFSSTTSDNPITSSDSSEPIDVTKQVGDSKNTSSHGTAPRKSRRDRIAADGPYTPPRIKSRAKTMIDSFHIRPAKQLSWLLDDLLPGTSGVPSSCLPARNMPQGSHLVYFPIQDTPSHLAPDGAESAHVPGGFDLTQPAARRVWVGGTLSYSQKWNRELLFYEPRKKKLPFLWTCTEKFGFMKTTQHKGETRAVVELKRVYGAVKESHEQNQSEEVTKDQRDWPLRETRLLAFLPTFEEQPAQSFPAPGKPTFEYKFLPTPEHLFQFSALTNNTHFIHLDREKGLVHGPLTLALMLRAIDHAAYDPTAARTDLKQISYRNLRPLYVGQEATVCLRQRPGEDDSDRVRSQGKANWTISTWDVWIQGPDGSMAVRATAQVRRIIKKSAETKSETEVPETEPVEAEPEVKLTETESIEAKPAEAVSEAKVTETEPPKTEAAETEAKPAEENRPKV